MGKGLKTELSMVQKFIIKKICQIQIDSLLEMSNDFADDIYLRYKIAGIDFSKGIFEAERDKEVILFMETQSNPESIFTILGPKDLSLVKHTLLNDFQGNERYNRKEVSGLWSKLFTHEDFYPQLSQIQYFN